MNFISSFCSRIRLINTLWAQSKLTFLFFNFSKYCLASTLPLEASCFINLNLSNWLGLRSLSLAIFLKSKSSSSCLRISTLSYYVPSNKHIDTGHVFLTLRLTTLHVLRSYGCIRRNFLLVIIHFGVLPDRNEFHDQILDENDHEEYEIYQIFQDPEILIHHG